MKKFTPQVKEKKIVMDGLTRDQSEDLGPSHSCLYRRLHCDIRKPTCRFEQHVVLSHRFDYYIFLNSVFVQIRGKEERYVIVRRRRDVHHCSLDNAYAEPDLHPSANAERKPSGGSPRCNGAIIFFIACLNVYKKAKKLNLETFYVLMDIR